MVSAAAEPRRSIPLATTTRIAPATIVLGVLLAAGALLILVAGRHLTFFYDEWGFILQRRGGGLGTFLDPHNGHLVLFPVLVYKVLFGIVGLRHYTPYRLVAVALHVVACAELYVLARRRIGPWLALAPATSLLFLGSAWQVLLWPFQISYLGSVVGGLGALLALEAQATRRRDAAATALLLLAVGSSGLGLAFVAGCAALILMRRDPWRRLWVVIVPIAMFGIWYVGWGTSEQTTSDALLSAPQYVADAAAGAAAGLAGLEPSWGPALAVLVVAGLAFASYRRAGGAPTPMLVAVLVAALAFWTLAALRRADSPDPTASRYVYAGAALILAALSDAAAGMRLRAAGIVSLLVLLLGAVVSNLGVLRDGERGLRVSDTSARVAFSAVQVAAPVVAPGFLPDPVNAPQVAAGPYLAAVHDLGSPALGLAELTRAPERWREAADGVLTRAERLTVVPAGPTGAGNCLRQGPGPATTEVTVRLGGAVAIDPGRHTRSSVVLRRFAATNVTPFAVSLAHPASIAFPSDDAPRVPWHVRVQSTGSSRICVS